MTHTIHDPEDLFPCTVVTAPASEVSPAEFLEHFIPRESELRQLVRKLSNAAMAGDREEVRRLRREIKAVPYERCAFDTDPQTGRERFAA